MKKKKKARHASRKITPTAHTFPRDYLRYTKLSCVITANNVPNRLKISTSDMQIRSIASDTYPVHIYRW